MDQTALKFIDERQRVLREAYEKYRNSYPPSSSISGNGHIPSPADPKEDTQIDTSAKKWAWRRWDDQELDKVITRCLAENDEEYRRLQSSSSREKMKRQRRIWIEDFLDDTGSMFRLYRKSEFNDDKALSALKETLAFRIKHREELIWSPLAPTISPSRNQSPSRRDSGRRESSASINSRTSAQSPRSSPDIDSQPVANGDTTLQGSLNALIDAQGAQAQSLLQLYPSSAKDPNNRPLVVVSLRHLDSDSDQTHPKTQALAAFERLRRYLARTAKTIDQGAFMYRIPLQFILIIDLAGGRVSTTAWDMARWFVREAADQFHGMCSAVFVVNYSWEFGTLWSFIKHVLPASAKARVSFPKEDDLLGYLGKETLPPSLRGTCTSPLPYDIPIFEDTSATELEISYFDRRSNLQSAPRKVSPLHPTSSQNPYFGYPAVRENGARHGLQHSRKRKRDLLRTLIWLFLSRTKNRFIRLYWRGRHLVTSSPGMSASVFILIALLAWSLKGRVNRLRGLIA